MNIFYAPPEQIQAGYIELLGQEAHHAAKVMRYGEGDKITVVDGRGGWYKGQISRVLRDSIQIEIEEQDQEKRADLIVALGIIKKKDRLEFAVEKAVELGASEIVLFQSKHTIKQNVRMDRLEATALSAMKQSLRAHLPEIIMMSSLEDVVDRYPSFQVLVAHEKEDREGGIPDKFKSFSTGLLLLVGPEGGFSVDEITFLKQKGAHIISLGTHRLRAETAVIAFLSQLI